MWAAKFPPGIAASTCIHAAPRVARYYQNCTPHSHVLSYVLAVEQEVGTDVAGLRHRIFLEHGAHAGQ